MFLLATDIFALKSISLFFFFSSTSSSFSRALIIFNLLLRTEYYIARLRRIIGTTVSGIGFDSDSSDSYFELGTV